VINYSLITSSLYIGTTPKAGDYDLLRSLGVRLVLNMRLGLPPARDRHEPPLTSMWLPTIDSPLFPIPMRVLRKGAQAALEVIEQGGAVYAHCSKGRHRGVVMGACILVARGMPADAAMRLIKEYRPIADPNAWHIRRRIVKFEQCWNDKKSEQLTKGC